MRERRMRMEMGIALFMLLIALILVVVGVHYFPIILIKAIVGIVLALWIVAMAA